MNSEDAELIRSELAELNTRVVGVIDYEIIGSGISDDDIAKSVFPLDTPCVELTKRNDTHEGLAFDRTSIARGYTSVWDTNADLYTDDNAQSVSWISPNLTGTLGSLDFVALLNNVSTNRGASGNAFLQNGLIFTDHNGVTIKAVVWASSRTTASQANFFTIPYYAGISYWFTITYTSGYWWMCVASPNIANSYVCQQETHTGIGTHLVNNGNTSVWVEIASTRPNWYSAFTGNYFYAYGAKIYRNGFGQNWSAEYADYQGCNNPNGSNPPNPFSGSLVGGTFMSFKYTDAVIQCF